MKSHTAFVYGDELMQYKLGDDHPFNPLRVKMTKELLRAVGDLPSEVILKPRVADDTEILAAHSVDYVNFIKSLNTIEADEDRLSGYGLSEEETPVFANMHEAAKIVCGATLTAAEAVMNGTVKHALNLSGGLHHALYGKASGFCVYNDAVVAIRSILKQYDIKILYVDTDAHHGDGVQWAFYEDPNVCTLSIHETGRYLFPGTGGITERGAGQGLNFSFNLPVDAFTEDDSWMECYEQAFLRVAESFRPDLILTQNGADGHYYDPLTHLHLTMDTYRKIPLLAHRLAHEYCDGRWVALGGGGYDLARVVPRAWAQIWFAMTEFIPSDNRLPLKWTEKWQKYTTQTIPTFWNDPHDLYEPIPRKEEIEYKNASTLRNALYILGGEEIGNRFRRK
jgi:acetoin utilization protein AcuC